MTAKQQLLEYVQGLTEEEAMDVLPFIVKPPPLTPAQLEGIERGLRSLDEGRKVSNEDMKRRFGISER